jgi:lysophospholipase L1-like esterase
MTKKPNIWLTAGLALSLAAAARAQPPAAAAPKAARVAPTGPRFASEIQAFAAADKANPPAPCQVVFVGSSTIHFWDTLGVDMAPIKVINRGFGGSTMPDANQYFDETVGIYKPKLVVYYEGDNDINAKRTSDQLLADFKTWVGMKDAKLGATPVLFISIKPSKIRWDQYTAQQEANAKLKAYIATRPDLSYLNIVPAMLDKSGQPLDIYRADGLHMVPAGYAIWTPIVKAAISQPTKTKAPGC